ncbi:MAG: dienelactone hydrolase family protein [Armatimonadetes bacterium]|nr:dienelactone hydrolase family protein [Armatimonadota bacterium]
MAPEIIAKDVDYRSGNEELRGYVAYPKNAKGHIPAVLIVHQWMGLTDYEKRRARQIAELGYVAFALDIYGKGVRPANTQEAGQLAGKYKGDRSAFRTKLHAGYMTMLTMPHVEPHQTAAIGYCFGGTGVLELARTGERALGFVSFHGGLDSLHPEEGAKIKGKVLVLHGADDPFVPKKDIDAFVSEMKTNHVNFRMVSYPGAVHSFTQKEAGNDNSKGAAYNADADAKSWVEMKGFLAGLFKK